MNTRQKLFAPTSRPQMMRYSSYNKLDSPLDFGRGLYSFLNSYVKIIIFKISCSDPLRICDCFSSEIYSLHEDVNKSVHNRYYEKHQVKY
jgi:hypothetical protein